MYLNSIEEAITIRDLFMPMCSKKKAFIYELDKTKDFYKDVIRTDIANSISPCGDPNITYYNYNKKFSLDCVKKHFRCLGINPEPLFSVYGINDPLNGGISYMSLEEGDCSISEIQ